MTTATYGKPETAREALALWDAGDSVFTVEMGGLGPGYEQVIHILAFEVIRELLQREPIDWDQSDDEWRALHASLDVVLSRQPAQELGSTGAQWGAAKNIALRTIRIGWSKALSELPADRIIQVSRRFPSVDTPPSVPAVEPGVETSNP